VENPRRPNADVIGVGFGPSNLGLAVAIEEHNLAVEASGGRILAPMFFERQPDFSWHGGMLLETATVQVSFLKDLVTMRNPVSDFSFVAYLHDQDRLADFINHKTLYPLRLEFNDYFAWAARRVTHLVTYSREVIEIRPVIEHGVISAFDVTVARPTKQVDVHRARNVVIATGLVPRLPEGVTLSDRVWHNFDLLRRVEQLERQRPPRRFVVVGAGQSAAETAEYLGSRFPQAEVCSVFSRFGYSPADDSSFVNRIFDPSSVDEFYSAPEHVKQQLTRYHRNTNYAAVDADLIDALYRRVYTDKVLGRQRLRVLHASRVAEVEEGVDGVTVSVEHLPDGRLDRLDADVIIYATGYRPSDPKQLLGRLGRLCRHDGAGRLSIGRDYRLDLTVPSRAGLFVTGASEHAHGLSSTLLSTIAVRAGELLASLRVNVSDHTAGAEQDWPLEAALRLASPPPARDAR
jgi:L-ornithine N5-oxygenase